MDDITVSVYWFPQTHRWHHSVSILVAHRHMGGITDQYHWSLCSFHPHWSTQYKLRVKKTQKTQWATDQKNNTNHVTPIIYTQLSLHTLDIFVSFDVVCVTNTLGPAQSKIGWQWEDGQAVLTWDKNIQITIVIPIKTHTLLSTVNLLWGIHQSVIWTFCN